MDDLLKINFEKEFSFGRSFFKVPITHPDIKPSEPFEIDWSSTANETSSETYIKRRFKEFADKWREETIALASPTKRYLNPNYWKIYNLGEEVVPFIIEELRVRPDAWFFLLQELTKQNPVVDTDKGDINRVTNAWLRWADQNL